MFSDDLKVWTSAIHTTIDACAKTSALCKSDLGLFKGKYCLSGMVILFQMLFRHAKNSIF